MSFLTQCSKTSMRNRPYCCGLTERLVTAVPVCVYRTLRWLRLPHPAVRPGEHFFGHPLDDRDELQVLRAELFGQEAVDLQRVVGVGGVHRGQRVPFDAGFSQTVQSGDHPVERGLSALVAAVRVVHLAGTVDRDPDQEVVVGQEARPGVIDQGRVGLDRVQDGLTRPTVLALQLQAAGEKSTPISVGSPPWNAKVTSS